MVFARQLLAIFTVSALIAAPFAAAQARVNGHGDARQLMHRAHAAHHDHAAMQSDRAATRTAHDAAGHKPAVKTAGHCKDGKGCCGGDKGSCGDTCHHACFGQLAVVPSVRALPFATAGLFALSLASWPPGWTAAPHPPPPRA